MTREVLDQALAVAALTSIVSERWNCDQADWRDAHLVHTTFMFAERFCYLNRTGVEELDQAAGMVCAALEEHLAAGEEWRAASDRGAADAAAVTAGACLVVAAENAARLVASLELRVAQS